MTDRPTFLTNLRLRVNDEDEVRWTDAELTGYLLESVGHYSRLFPRVREQEGACDGTSDRFSVPTDLIDRKIRRAWIVDTGRSTELIQYDLRRQRQTRWYRVIDDLVILGFVPASTASLRLEYAATHNLPAEDTEDDSSTIPIEDDDFIYLWAEHLAWRKIGAADANLSRWKEQGKRDDSPLIPQYVFLERQYDKMVKEKKAGARVLFLTRTPSRSRLSDRFNV